MKFAQVFSENPFFETVTLGLLAFYTGEPLTLAIGGPLTYGLSHLVFLAGLYLAGKRYAVALAHWAARKALASLSGKED